MSQVLYHLGYPLMMVAISLRQGFWGKVWQFIPCLHFFFFFKVEISSYDGALSVNSSFKSCEAMFRPFTLLQLKLVLGSKSMDPLQCYLHKIWNFVRQANERSLCVCMCVLFFRVNTETRDFEEVKEGDISMADFQSDVSNDDILILICCIFIVQCTAFPRLCIWHFPTFYLMLS